MTGSSRGELVYAITLHQPWATLIALGVKTVETRSWPAPERLLGQTIAIHAGKRVARDPGVAVENEMRVRLGKDWRRTIPAGAVLATAVLAGMARVDRVDPRVGHALHDLSTNAGCAVGLGRLGSTPGATSALADGYGSWPTRGQCPSRYRPSDISCSGVGISTAGSCRCSAGVRASICETPRTLSQ